MHSQHSYKIYICSVILGELEYFRNYKGFSFILPKILDVIQRITKVRILPILHHIFESENFRFPFFYEQ